MRTSIEAGGVTARSTGVVGLADSLGVRGRFLGSVLTGALAVTGVVGVARICESVAAALGWQSVLCCGHAATWQRREQYTADVQREQRSCATSPQKQHKSSSMVSRRSVETRDERVDPWRKHNEKRSLKLRVVGK